MQYIKYKTKCMRKRKKSKWTSPLCCTVNPLYICVECKLRLCGYHGGGKEYYAVMFERNEIGEPTKAAAVIAQRTTILHNWEEYDP